MEIKIKNDMGVFCIGGGNDPVARLSEIIGLGLPQKESATVIFAGQPGRTQTGIRDMERVITISFDFYGGQYEVEKLYKILYNEADIFITSGTRRRKITGQCLNATEAERIIYNSWQKIVLQFTCNDPYFHDFDTLTIPIFKRIDNLPNSISDDGKYQISLPAIATTRTSEATITNKGDVLVYPVIKILNQATATTPIEGGVKILNDTTGAKITLNHDIVAGENVVIDLSRRRITSNTNGDITNKISDDTILSDFFLQTGQNAILVLPNTPSLSLAAVAEYTNNYASAVI